MLDVERIGGLRDGGLPGMRSDAYSEMSSVLMRTDNLSPEEVTKFLRVEVSIGEISVEEMQGDYLFALLLYPKTDTNKSYISLRARKASDAAGYFQADELSTQMHLETDRLGALLLRAGQLHVSLEVVAERTAAGEVPDTDNAMKALLEANFKNRRLVVQEKSYDGY